MVVVYKISQSSEWRNRMLVMLGWNPINTLPTSFVLVAIMYNKLRTFRDTNKPAFLVRTVFRIAKSNTFWLWNKPQKYVMFADGANTPYCQSQTHSTRRPGVMNTLTCVSGTLVQYLVLPSIEVYFSYQMSLLSSLGCIFVTDVLAVLRCVFSLFLLKLFEKNKMSTFASLVKFYFLTRCCCLYTGRSSQSRRFFQPLSLSLSLSLSLCHYCRQWPVSPVNRL